MNFFCIIFIFICTLSSTLSITQGSDEDSLTNLLNIIKETLTTDNEPFFRQPQQTYNLPNNGISLGIYEALRSITKNDDLECVPRLLCEAAAGGQPGHTGKQIKFDKQSLNTLLTYLNLDATKSSPLLVFTKAALLGVSNRGDPYTCISNYAKCPKDQSRLLYYLNNHRGGFFQYFDKKEHKPANYYYQSHYRPGSYNYIYQNKYKRNKIRFSNSNNLLEKFKGKETTGIYAKKYGHSSFKFPGNNKKITMVFPKGDAGSRILINPNSSFNSKTKFFFDSGKYPKKINSSKFFPQKEERQTPVDPFVTDRLPHNFHFPISADPLTKDPKNLFFPNS